MNVFCNYKDDFWASLSTGMKPQKDAASHVSVVDSQCLVTTQSCFLFTTAPESTKAPSDTFVVRNSERQRHRVSER